LFERFADRGVVVEMPNVVFLPLPALNALSRAAAVRAGLPRARIHQS
jgi:hypothetical protein